MTAPEKLDLRSHDAAVASLRLVHAEARRGGGEKIFKLTVDWPPYPFMPETRERVYGMDNSLAAKLLAA